jgi:tetratricopeptide (TPR) repeat protein
MYIYSQQPHLAVGCFEKVLQAYPDNYETLKILGSLYASASDEPTIEKAIRYLRRVTELNSTNYKAWMELSQLLETTDQPEALAGYERYVSCTHTRAERRRAREQDTQDRILISGVVLVLLSYSSNSKSKFLHRYGIILECYGMR